MLARQGQLDQPFGHHQVVNDVLQVVCVTVVASFRQGEGRDGPPVQFLYLSVSYVCFRQWRDECAYLHRFEPCLLDFG